MFVKKCSEKLCSQECLICSQKVFWWIGLFEVQSGLLKKVDSILDSTQPPPSGAHHAQVVHRCHLRPFNYVALRRSPPSETATSTKTPSHAQCSVRHNTRSSCKTAANIQVHQRIYSCAYRWVLTYPFCSRWCCYSSAWVCERDSLMLLSLFFLWEISLPLLHRWPTLVARTRPGAGRHPLSSITSQQQCCE